MNKKFVYLFCLGGNIQWSGDTANVAISRGLTEADRAEIKEFVERCEVGHHMILSTGEFLFCVEDKSSSNKTITVNERNIIDYSLCFLNANFSEDNEESLGMNHSAFSRHIKVIKSKL
jgi:hypothetical protein